MLVDKYIKKLISIENIYFSNKLIDSKADIVKYSQASLNYPGIKVIFFSNIIDLRVSLIEIKSNFSRRLKHHINQAEKKYNISVIFEKEPNKNKIKDFVLFFNCFAKSKKIPFADQSQLKRISKNVIFTKAIFNNKVIVWHVYIHDKFRLRLLYSSNILNKDNNLEKTIGLANKYLHYQDIIYAKKEGFTVYDMGGISAKSDKLAGIDEFKLKFSKNIEQTSNFILANTIKGKTAFYTYRFAIALKSIILSLSCSIKKSIVLLNIFFKSFFKKQ